MAVLIDGAPQIMALALRVSNTSSLCHVSPGLGRRRRN
jgi:hypothetical protein